MYTARPYSSTASTPLSISSLLLKFTAAAVPFFLAYCLGQRKSSAQQFVTIFGADPQQRLQKAGLVADGATDAPMFQLGT